MKYGKETLIKEGVILVAFFVVAQIFVSVTFIGPAFAATGVPEIINHQGRLLSLSGDLLGGNGTNYCFRFSIWNVSTGGTRDPNQLWPSSFAVPSTMTVSVKNGVFAVGIGSGVDTLNLTFKIMTPFILT